MMKRYFFLIIIVISLFISECLIPGKIIAGNYADYQKKITFHHRRPFSIKYLIKGLIT